MTDPAPGAMVPEPEPEEDPEYPQQSEEDLLRVLDNAREQGRKLVGSKRQASAGEAADQEEARVREMARKEKVLLRLRAKKEITFGDLFDLGLGKPAETCTLKVEVLRKVMEHWPSSKQVRVVDTAGDARSVFFYTEEENPYFDVEDVREGNQITFSDPFLHYFMDGQTGLRVEKASTVKLEPIPGFDHSRRLAYARAEKSEGTRWVKLKKWDEALARYGYALEHVTGCPTADPDVAAQRYDIEKNLYMNLALVLLAKENYEETIKMCRKALDIDPNLPKALFRLGQAQAKERQPEQAEASFLRALELAPGDPMVKEALRSLRGTLKERREAESLLWKGKIQKEPSRGAEADSVQESSPIRPPAPPAIASQTPPRLVGFNSLLISASLVAVLSTIIALIYATSQVD